MWKLAEKIVESRLLLGTAQYPSLDIMQQAIKASSAEIITVSLKRQLSYEDIHSTVSLSHENTHHAASLSDQGTKKPEPFWDIIKSLNCHLLPNTAGCRNANDAINVAEMAREIFQTSWIKLEVIGDEFNLQPDPIELIQAARVLVKNGFEVFPYCTDDLVLCQRLVDCGCDILMPWAAPIGSGKGLINPYALETLRNRLPNITLIVDAGIGKPSHATQAMELGFDGVLLNTAVSLAHDPIKMATAFKNAVTAGRAGYEAGMIIEKNIASPSTPLLDTPFWHSVS